MLSVAVSMGTNIPCRLRNESRSISAITRNVNGIRTATARDCSLSLIASTGSPAK